MPAPLELAGKRFGLLTVVARSHKNRHHAWMWLCRCDCGRSVYVQGSTLNTGRTSACSSCATRLSSTTHGQSNTPLFRRWQAMKARTSNKNSAAWRNYGGRGIRVCDEWQSYEAFARDMGPTFQPHLELDRIDVNGNYEPSNCRWTTRDQQQNNTRRNHRVTWRGCTLTVTEWADVLGIKPNTLLYRLRRGWSIERALETP